MRLCARRFRGSLLVAALAIGAGVPAAGQEFQLDSQALDASGAAASAPARRKGRKAAGAAPQAAAAKPAAARPGPQPGGPNRQFGELEGWSPGKAPPKPKDSRDAEPGNKKNPAMPVGMSPSGNMAVGLPF